MRKGLFAILLLFITGCGNVFYSIDCENVDKIEFIVDNHNFLIKEDKYPIIIDSLNECVKTNINIDHLDSIWKIVVFTNEEKETYYLGCDGILVKEEKGNYIILESKDLKPTEIFKEALGNNIFLGNIIQSEKWINDNNNKSIFCFDENLITDISIQTTEGVYYVNKQKKSDFIKLLNNEYYESYEDGLTTGIINSFINIIYNEETYKINLFTSNDINILKVIVEKDKEGAATLERTYYLRNQSDLINVYQQITDNQSNSVWIK